MADLEKINNGQDCTIHAERMDDTTFYRNYAQVAGNFGKDTAFQSERLYLCDK
jgi:hypothetical protein